MKSLHCVALGAVLATAGIANAQSADPEVAAKTLRKCLQDGLKERAENNTLKLKKKPEWSEYTDLYLAQRYAEQLQAQADKKPEALVITCIPGIVDDYVEALRAAEKARGDGSAKTLAGGGTRPLESDSVFIRTGNSLMGGHVRGHSDITVDAINALAQADAFSKDARELLEWSAQSADLYYWNDHLYHAHSTECPQDVPDICAEAARKQQADYPTFLEARLTAVREASAVPNGTKVPDALFELGGLLHAVQDLVYHRGMSMVHHAGLSYVMGQNPDAPKEPNLVQARDQLAQELSKRVLTVVKVRLGAEKWNQLRNWRKPNGVFKYKKLAESIKGKQDMTLGALLKYVASSRVYVLNPQRKDELKLASDGFWKPEEIVKALEKPEAP
jgi:hypothetical protein